MALLVTFLLGFLAFYAVVFTMAARHDIKREKVAHNSSEVGAPQSEILK